MVQADRDWPARITWLAIPSDTGYFKHTITQWRYPYLPYC